LKKEIQKALDKINFREPTDVQRQVIPIALQGRDIMVQSQTGTGKTAAFGLPILHNFVPEEFGIKALVLAPTRELALQIAKEMGRYNTFTKAHIVPIYGGQKIQTQFSLLKKGADIVVSTPGRLIDHLGRNTISLANVQVVVLDEADRMLDMGFIDDIVRILRHTPTDRQTMLFTATLMNEVQMIARDFMRKPERIMLSRDELVVPDIDETFYRIGRKNKLWALMQMITLENPKQGIIFCETKRMVDIVAERLHKLKIKAMAIHGDLRQHKRERIMKDFRNGAFRFLVATDVAARGLDIPAVSHVFNYDVPENKEQYVHRVGRTGRIGAKGRAITFVSKESFAALSEIERFLGREIDFEEIPEGKPETVKDEQGRPVKKGNPLRKVWDFDDISDEYGMVKLELDVGKDRDVNQFELIQWLSDGDHMWDMNIGTVNIGDDRTVIEVKKHVVGKTMDLLRRKKFKGQRIHYEIIERG
jgi:ATP-dependent RNA helicase DeaD